MEHKTNYDVKGKGREGKEDVSEREVIEDTKVRILYFLYCFFDDTFGGNKRKQIKNDCEEEDRE